MFEIKTIFKFSVKSDYNIKTKNLCWGPELFQNSIWISLKIDFEQIHLEYYYNQTSFN
jgi:hypothetical protein